MSEMIFTHLGCYRFDIALFMGEKITQGSCVIMCKNAVVGPVPYEIA